MTETAFDRYNEKRILAMEQQVVEEVRKICLKTMYDCGLITQNIFLKQLVLLNQRKQVNLDKQTRQSEELRKNPIKKQERQMSDSINSFIPKNKLPSMEPWDVMSVITEERIRKSVLKAIQREIYNTSKEKGFWEGDETKLEKLALIGTEVSEAIEALRNHDKNDGTLTEHKGVAVELADVIIRVFDFAHGFEYDVISALVEKIERNKTRDYKHGKTC